MIRKRKLFKNLCGSWQFIYKCKSHLIFLPLCVNSIMQHYNIQKQIRKAKVYCLDKSILPAYNSDNFMKWL